MTFIEAALEILRREGIPLHARVIADKAVDAQLLSHVGKTPVQTMSKRISASVAKGKGPFARVKPGVFALEEWKDESGKISVPKRSEEKKQRIESPADNPIARKVTVPNEPPSNPPAPKEPAEPKLNEPAPRSGSPNSNDAPSMERAAGSEQRDGAPRRRSRHKKSRPPREHASQERRPNDTDSHSGKDNYPPSSESRHAGDPRRNNDLRDNKRNDNRQNQRNEPRAEGGKNRRGREENRPSPQHRERNGTATFADAVEVVLGQQNHPLQSRIVADRLRFPSANADMIVDALLDSDNLERARNGRRPRFAKHKNGWTLSAREIPSEVVALEESIFDSAVRLTSMAERQVHRKLKSLSLGKLAQLVTMVLKQMGYSAVEPASRGNKEADIHLRATDRRHGGRFWTAVIIRKDIRGHAISDGEVSTLRGSLHHYRASRGLIITTGEISSEAHRESDIPNVAPIGFIDGKALAIEMVRCGIGVEKRMIPVAFFDESSF